MEVPNVLILLLFVGKQDVKRLNLYHIYMKTKILLLFVQQFNGMKHIENRFVVLKKKSNIIIVNSVHNGEEKLQELNIEN